MQAGDEAGQAVGTDVHPGLLRQGDQSGPVDWVTCSFISVAGQEHPNEDLPRAVFEVSLASVDTEDTARKYFDAGRAELGKKAKIAPVRDLGDAAFTAEACSGKVCVQTLWFRTGNLILFVVAENVYESRPAPVALARRALGRI